MGGARRDGRRSATAPRRTKRRTSTVFAANWDSRSDKKRGADGSSSFLFMPTESTSVFDLQVALQAGVVGGQIPDVLLGKALGHGHHHRVLARALLVITQRL